MIISCAQCGENVISLDKNTLCAPTVVVLSEQVIVHSKCLLKYKAIKSGLTHVCQECQGAGGKDWEEDKVFVWEDCRFCRGSGVVRDEPLFVRVARAAISSSDVEVKVDSERKIKRYEDLRNKILGSQRKMVTK